MSRQCAMIVMIFVFGFTGVIRAALVNVRQYGGRGAGTNPTIVCVDCDEGTTIKGDP